MLDADIADIVVNVIVVTVGVLAAAGIWSWDDDKNRHQTTRGGVLKPRATGTKGTPSNNLDPSKPPPKKP